MQRTCAYFRSSEGSVGRALTAAVSTAAGLRIILKPGGISRVYTLVRREVGTSWIPLFVPYPGGIYDERSKLFGKAAGWLERSHAGLRGVVDLLRPSDARARPRDGGCEDDSSKGNRCDGSRGDECR